MTTVVNMWPDLVRSVDGQNGVELTSMDVLKRLEGAQRLTPAVRAAIDDRMRTLGLGHLPEILPERADEPVLLYRQGTMAGEVIRVVQGALKGSVAQAAVVALRQMNAMSDAEHTVLSVDDVKERAHDALSALQSLIDLTQEAPPEARGGTRR